MQENAEGEGTQNYDTSGLPNRVGEEFYGIRMFGEDPTIILKNPPMQRFKHVPPCKTFSGRQSTAEEDEVKKRKIPMDRAFPHPSPQREK